MYMHVHMYEKFQTDGKGTQLDISIIHVLLNELLKLWAEIYDSKQVACI